MESRCTSPLSDLDALYDDSYTSEEDEDPNAFKIRKALKPPNHKVYTTQELHNLIHEGLIDLNPAYQRDVVWPEAKQSNLIDSLWHNYHVPSIVFVVQRDDENEELRVCVDGKQRLTSIQRFLDGQIPYKDGKKSWWFTLPHKYAGKANRFEIPREWKDVFLKKVISCDEYCNINEDSEREIFRRVQLGMTLTAAEKLRAICSPWASWINQLEGQHIMVEGGLAQALQWDLSRARDFQNLLHMVYCCDGLPNDERIPSPPSIEKWLQREDAPGQQFMADIDRSLRDLWQIAKSDKYSYPFTKIAARIAPVEFTFIGVLLYTLDGSSLEAKARAIYTLRATVRREHKDIRFNSTVGRALWSFVDSLRHNPMADIIQRESPSKPKARKRKADDDADGEYRPQPIRNIGKGAKTRARTTRS